MRTTAVSKLKASLSEYLSHVKQGEEVVVTDRGKPIAKIVPYVVEGNEAERRLDLARRGVIRLGKGRISSKFLKPPRVKDPDGLLLRYLIEEREAGQ